MVQHNQERLRQKCNDGSVLQNVGLYSRGCLSSRRSKPKPHARPCGYANFWAHPCPLFPWKAGAVAFLARRLSWGKAKMLTASHRSQALVPWKGNQNREWEMKKKKEEMKHLRY